jgi:hypothetical protein
MHMIMMRLPLSIRVSLVRPKDGRAMRIETVINAPRDLRCNARLPNLATCRTRRMAVTGEDPPPGESALELDGSMPSTTRSGCTPPSATSPDDEHDGRGEAIRQTRRDGSPRRGWTASHTVEHHPEENQRSRAARGCVFPPRPGSLSKHTSAC